MTALEAGQLQLDFAGLTAAIRTGNGAGTIRRAALQFADVGQFGCSVGQTDDDHAVMQQGVMEAGHRRFVAAAGAGGDEDAADLADQSALHPEAAGLVEKIAHLAAHVAEPGAGTEDDGIVIGQFGRAGDRRGLVPLAAGLLEGLLRNRLGNPLDGDLGAGDLAGAGGDGFRHLLHMAVHRVIKYKNFCHLLSPALDAGEYGCRIKGNNDRLGTSLFPQGDSLWSIFWIWPPLPRWWNITASAARPGLCACRNPPCPSRSPGWNDGSAPSCCSERPASCR